MLHLLLLVCQLFAVGRSVVLDLENFQGVGNVNTVPRANASQQMVVHLLKNGIIRYEMCIHKPVEMQIYNIMFSNDAGNKGDIVTVDIDGKLIGSFNTAQPSTDQNSAWNDFYGSGIIGDRFFLDYGHHMLTLYVKQADSFGLELDTIELDTGNDTLEIPDMACDLYCFNDINFRSSVVQRDTDGFKIKQFSRPTVCSEEENVKVALYHDLAKNFDIKATRPQYKSCANNRNPDYRGCKLASPAWRFQKVPLVSGTAVKQDRASLLVDADSSVVRVAVTFDMSGFSATRGQGESRSAGLVFVRLGNVEGPVRTTLSYRGKGGTMIKSKEFTFTEKEPHHAWYLPDDIWGLNDDNSIILQMHDVSPSSDRMLIKEIKLEKKQPTSKVDLLYDDGMFVWEGIHLDTWWMSHQQITTVKVKTGNGFKVYDDVENVRLYMKKPYGDGYAQIFVLHNDGHGRIQPVTPHGMDWTPFGSSFIIGPNKPESLRPYASIKNIDIDPITMQMSLTYNDGSSVILKIVPTATETLVKVRQYKVPQGRENRALLTFLSMWIQDGYSNMDSIALDDVEIEGRVIDGLNEYSNATKLNFYRKCISRLNTQSPDIQVQMRGQLLDDLA